MMFHEVPTNYLPPFVNRWTYKHLSMKQGGKKTNKNQWPKPSHKKQKGRPKKGQKTCSS